MTKFEKVTKISPDQIASKLNLREDNWMWFDKDPVEIGLNAFIIGIDSTGEGVCVRAFGDVDIDVALTAFSDDIIKKVGESVKKIVK